MARVQGRGAGQLGKVAALVPDSAAVADVAAPVQLNGRLELGWDETAEDRCSGGSPFIKS